MACYETNFKLNFFEPKFSNWKLELIEIDLANAFHNKQNLELKKFDFLVTKVQADLMISIINKLLKKSLNELKQIINSNPWWLENYNLYTNKKWRFENDQILNSFNDLWWIGSHLE